MHLLTYLNTYNTSLCSFSVAAVSVWNSLPSGIRGVGAGKQTPSTEDGPNAQDI